MTRRINHRLAQPTTDRNAGRDVEQVSPRRQGSVLLLVLVVIMLLSFSAYSFSELMIAEYAATSALTDQVRTQALAESGIEAVAAQFDELRDGTFAGSVVDAQPFRHQVVDDDGQHVGRYSILQRLPAAGDATAAFGLVDESAKLNLNALPLEAHKRQQSRERLLALPGMTEAIADAILDWMDADDEPSEFGAESEWYSAQSPPRRPAQRRLQSLDELLHVRGVTPELLWGEDANQNGQLDLNENDGRASAPVDNRDGVLDRGWLDLLTLHGREANALGGRVSKINVNHDDLPELFDQIEQSLGLEAARFIVAWRLAGSAFGSESQRVGSASAGLTADGPSGERQRRRRETALDRLRRQLGRESSDDEADTDESAQPDAAGAETSGSDGNAVVKGGLNLSRKPAYAVRSIFDLLGTTVRIDVDRRDTVLKSPWPDDPTSIERSVVLLNERLTTSSDAVIAGRVNVNEASRDVLRTVPGLSDSLADAIVAAQRRANGNDEISRRHQTIAWLYVEGLIDLRQLRSLAPWLTTRGDVFRGISVGHLDGRRVTSTIDFLLDASGDRTRILQVVDRAPSSLPVAAW